MYTYEYIDIYIYIYVFIYHTPNCRCRCRFRGAGADIATKGVELNQKIKMRKHECFQIFELFGAYYKAFLKN